MIISRRLPVGFGDGLKSGVATAGGQQRHLPLGASNFLGALTRVIVKYSVDELWLKLNRYKRARLNRPKS